MDQRLNSFVCGLLLCCCIGQAIATGCDRSYNVTGVIILPTNLTEGQSCTWTILQGGKDVKTMAVHLTSLVISPEDSLVIYDGDNKGFELMNVTDSSVVSAVAAVFKKKATIIFSVGKNHSKSQGEIQFDVDECSVNLTNALALRVTSPSFNPDQADLNCTYQVSNALPLDRMAVVSFAEFNVSSGSTLELTSGQKAMNFSGDGEGPQPDFFTDPNNGNVTISFFIKKNSSEQTFSLVFGAFVKACTSEEEFSNVTSKLTWSPDLPSQPDVAYACRWRVGNPGDGAALMAMLTEFELAQSDRLVLTPGSSSQGEAVAQLGGSVAPDYLTLTSSPALVATLTLSTSFGPRSLNMSIETQSFGGRLTGSGVLVAGNSTKATDAATDKVDAFYQLVATEGQQVKLTLDTQLTNDTTLTLYNGLQVTDGVLITLDAHAFEQGLQSITGGTDMLVALTNLSAQDNFTATFSSVTQGCNELVTAPTGQLIYTMEPKNETAICTWIIAPSAKAGVTVLTLNTLNLGPKDSVVIYSKPDSSIAQFMGPLSMGPFPQINAPANTPTRVSIYRAETYRKATKVVVTFKVVPQVCGGALGTAGSLTTPNFPNQYPLNAQCQWTLPASEQMLYLNFESLDLKQNHSIKVIQVDNSSLVTLAEYMGSAESLDTLPKDLIVPINNMTSMVTFSSDASSTVAGEDVSRVGNGAKLNYKVLDCGGNVSMSNASFTSPGYPKPPTSTGAQCVWIIELPPLEDSQDADPDHQTIQFTVLAKGDAKKIDQHLKIYDGPSTRSPLSTASAQNGTSGTVLSRYPTITVVFDLEKGAKDKVAFNLTYTTYTCNKTQQCDNGVCMHPGWRCNEVDNCGDGSDERNCLIPVTPKPKPAPADYSGWVKTGWVPACLFIGIVLGGLLVVIVPKIIRRFRGGSNYSRMHDDRPVVA